MSYRPKLPRRVISSGFISNAQFEFIVAAGQAHSRHLPVDQENPGEKPMRAGIFLADGTGAGKTNEIRSEEHTSDLQSLMRNSYAVFCSKKKTKNTSNQMHSNQRQQHDYYMTITNKLN